jgi:hypothetical protein
MVPALTSIFEFAAIFYLFPVWYLRFRRVWQGRDNNIYKLQRFVSGITWCTFIMLCVSPFCTGANLLLRVADMNCRSKTPNPLCKIGKESLLVIACYRMLPMYVHSGTHFSHHYTNNMQDLSCVFHGLGRVYAFTTKGITYSAIEAWIGSSVKGERRILRDK